MMGKIQAVYGNYSHFRHTKTGFNFYIKTKYGRYVKTLDSIRTEQVDKHEAIKVIYNMALVSDGPVKYDPIGRAGVFN